MTDEPVNNLTDEQMIAAAASMSTRDFSALDGEADGDGYMLLRFAIANQPGAFGIRLPLPSSPASKPWLYTIPTDAADAASMLATFIDEEVATECGRGEGPAAAADQRPAGQRRAVVEKTAAGLW